LNNRALAFAFGIGVVAGLRTFTAPAVVSWAARLRWVHLEGTRFAFMGSRAALAVCTLAALGELIADQLPKVPKRTDAGPLTARILVGTLAGATLCVAAGRPALYGVMLGGLGAVVGAFAGYQARTRLVRQLGVPDFLIAIPEDLIAIGLAFLLATRL
jgi:uncharacterized membrane protein